MITPVYKKITDLLCSSGKFKINLGLGRMVAILNLLDNPQDKIRVIHIAGTNGKGSVCTLTAEILSASGYKTALYTSPHLLKYNERLKINGINISDEKLAEYIFSVDELAKKNNIDLTEFEILTACAYKYFYDEKVDFAVMETGLGGRFDAVNVVQNPLLTAITSISVDHKDRLGDTVEKIAFEKAGIIKNNVPVAINHDNRGKAVIMQVAQTLEAPVFLSENKVEILYENGINYAVFDGKKHEFRLWGLHQKQNLELVLKMVQILKMAGVEISDEDIASALKTAFIPARFQYNKEKNIIIDGCHNEDASIILRKNLDFYFPDKNRVWIYGTMSTKEYGKVVNNLFQNGDTVYLVKFSNPMSVSEDDIAKTLPENHKINIKKFSKTANILNFSQNNNLIIITGSFYMIGDLFSGN